MTISIRQKLLTGHARILQKPLLSLLSSPRILRSSANLNATILHAKARTAQFEEVSNDSARVRVRAGQQKAQGAILYLHGGGFILGGLHGYRALTATLAAKAAMPVYFLEYAKAPEHPYPTAINQAEDAFTNLTATYGAGSIRIMGDSAGGGLALALLHRLIAKQSALPQALALLSPLTNLATELPSFKNNKRSDALLSPAFVRRGNAAYTAGLNAKNPEISPLFGHFEGAPKIQIQADRSEILYDQSVAMAAHLKAQSVAVELCETDGLFHCYQMYTGRTPEADHSLELAATFLVA